MVAPMVMTRFATDNGAVHPGHGPGGDDDHHAPAQQDALVQPTKQQAETTRAAWPTTTNTAAFPAAHSDADTAARHAGKREDPPETMSTSSMLKKRKFTHTNAAQRDAMLSFLEQDTQYGLLRRPTPKEATTITITTATEGATAADEAEPVETATMARTMTNAPRKKRKKTDGFRALMRHVNALELGTNPWTMAVAKSRFESMLASFKRTRAATTGAAFSVSTTDRARGLTSRALKRNAMCRGYDRIEALLPKEDDGGGPGPVAGTATATGNDGAVHEMAAMTKDALERQRQRVESMKAQAANDQSSTGTEAEAVVIERERQLQSQLLALESDRLALMQATLALQQRELRVQMKEQHERHQCRANVLKRMRLAGASDEEIKRIRALLSLEVSVASTTEGL